MIRDDVKAALITAMKARDSETTAALRLIQAAIRYRDIEERTGNDTLDDDKLVIEVLLKMAKQRRESIDMYEKGGRPELAAKEEAELKTINSFLPKQMSEEEAKVAITGLIAETSASSIKDMGKVMALIKERYASEMDMSKAGPLVKSLLNNN
ncbi:MAG: GatB/YqeY domain-containing protein [Zymomonas mobilis subsp. pomaceae]|uniref:GatB/YqeY domain-containing protein n=1 Tax=Zymomonas mobilis TaxID=542 RepID=UPI0039E9FF2D